MSQHCDVDPQDYDYRTDCDGIPPCTSVTKSSTLVARGRLECSFDDGAALPRSQFSYAFSQGNASFVLTNDPALRVVASAVHPNSPGSRDVEVATVPVPSGDGRYAISVTVKPETLPATAGRILFEVAAATNVTLQDGTGMGAPAYHAIELLSGVPPAPAPKLSLAGIIVLLVLLFAASSVAGRVWWKRREARLIAEHLKAFKPLTLSALNLRPTHLEHYETTRVGAHHHHQE